MSTTEGGPEPVAKRAIRGAMWRAAFAVLALVPLLDAGCATRPEPAPPPPPSPRATPPPPPPPPSPGRIEGRTVPMPGAPASADSAPVVVYANRLDGKRGRPPRDPVEILGRGGSFWPPFVAVAAGQSVRFVNEDQIYHRIFSYSEPNAFDAGTLEAGKSQTVRFAEPGLVRFYCAMHQGEAGVVYVAPSAHYATVRGDGAFEISGLPPGRYALHTWSESLADVRLEVTVRAGRATSVEIPVDPIREAE